MSDVMWIFAGSILAMMAIAVATDSVYIVLCRHTTTTSGSYALRISRRYYSARNRDSMVLRLADHPMAIEHKIENYRLMLNALECNAIATHIVRGGAGWSVQHMLCSSNRNIRLTGVALAGQHGVSTFARGLHNILRHDNDGEVVSEALRLLLTHHHQIDISVIRRCTTIIGDARRRPLLRSIAREQGECHTLLLQCSLGEARRIAWITDIYKYVLK